jgi:hypothetical protein
MRWWMEEVVDLKVEVSRSERFGSGQVAQGGVLARSSMDNGNN